MKTTARSRPGVRPWASPLVQRDLEEVERRLASVLACREPLLTEVASHLLFAGGKRVRPAVVLLVFRACGGEDPAEAIDAAAALELIHSASLLHDDIIDGGSTRRGAPSAPSRYGLGNALVAGDFLFSRAFGLCGRFDEELIRWAAEACVALTEGEIMQGRLRRDPAARLEDYLEIVARKTASLFEVGARTAARLAGARAIEASIAEGGRHVGMAFQMIDDVLDVDGSPDETGKDLAIDLRDGNPSLPVVLALPREARVRELFARPSLTEAETAEFLECLRRTPYLEEARRLAREHGERARQALAVLPPSPYREDLERLVDQLLERAA